MNIPVHKMELSSSLGFILKPVEENEGPPVQEEELMTAHRDDHYVFILQEKGQCSLMVDFNFIEINGPALFFILPGQVHHYISLNKTAGWFFAVDTALVNTEFRPVFEEQFLGKQVLQLDASLPFSQCLGLINRHAQQASNTVYYQHVIHSLINAFLGMVAGAFTGNDKNTDGKLPRAAGITRQFRKLVAQNFARMKNPSDYARELNLSLSYLNEVVKAATGFTVSYWIQQEVMMEAKRLLYYTELSVKEIAHKSGYDDHAYFSRLFKQRAECTPLDFRNKYRELSNHSR